MGEGIVNQVNDWENLSKRLQRRFNKYHIENNILYRKIRGNRDHYALLIPNKSRIKICKSYHDDAAAGHPETQKTFANIS